MFFHYYPDALGSFTLSLYSSILASDLVFHFLPAACTGYPFWSCIPGCDHSKLHGKFLFNFIFISNPDPLSPGKTHSTVFFFVVFFALLQTSPVFLGTCVLKIDVPSVLHGLCVSVVCNPLPEEEIFLFLAGHFPFFCHTYKNTLCLFVTHLLASKSQVLAVVSICVCQ